MQVSLKNNSGLNCHQDFLTMLSPLPVSWILSLNLFSSVCILSTLLFVCLLRSSFSLQIHYLSPYNGKVVPGSSWTFYLISSRDLKTYFSISSSVLKFPEKGHQPYIGQLPALCQLGESGSRFHTAAPVVITWAEGIGIEQWQLPYMGFRADKPLVATSTCLELYGYLYQNIFYLSYKSSFRVRIVPSIYICKDRKKKHIINKLIKN